ncbi:NAD-dependent malic enzyme [Mangrovactinospora gilvigrisea]|uniref:NAD-dependent malic enzyme n=1 Tax=Mangrovactinospora gilvigrisea TaxID=1428644 RepID=A0A1J7BA05_9ACTN|nr:malic enzyme-like NAD(P)-binding protein [Mangrovactinospora gilvigrisea]OIV35429.1 NAD-dependent malic enzyme [Mangrovactinospora gilvigrisea]
MPVIEDPAAAAPAPTDAEVFAAHLGGKLRIQPPTAVLDARSLSVISTPGVATVSRAIAADPSLAARYTWAHRLVAVVSDGTAVLGLGDVGPTAALPVMEAKSAMFKSLGGLDSVPLVLHGGPDVPIGDVVDTLVRLRPSFGAVNLEDVAAPRCFELEAALIEALDCPVMHNDQHGTAIAILAALRGAARLQRRELGELRAVVAGAGAAGAACARMLVGAGVGEVVVLDSRGVLHPLRPGLVPHKLELAALTNRRGRTGGLADVLPGADVFVGLSSSRVGEELIASMAPGAIVFALSNPVPEVDPAVARRHAAVVATGRSCWPNQISNLLACPGVFRGALDAGATRITDAMKFAAADALFELAAEDLSAESVVPDVLDPRVAPEVAAAVAAAAAAAG